MKKLVVALFFIIGYNSLGAQDIIIGVYKTELIKEKLIGSTLKSLENKLYTAITTNGIAKPIIKYDGQRFLYDPRFILVPSFNIIDKTILPTSPPKISLKVGFSLHLGNGYEGNRFSTYNEILIGIGRNEARALQATIDKFNPRNEELLEFLEEGKTKITNYYDEVCETIIEKAITLQNQNEHEVALRELSSIPESAGCYKDAVPLIEKNYKSYIDIECLKSLNKAKAAWVTHQNSSAIRAAAILSEIEPQASCFSEVKKMYKEITEFIQKDGRENKEWNYKLKKLENNTNLEVIKAINLGLSSQKRVSKPYNTKIIEEWGDD